MMSKRPTHDEFLKKALAKPGVQAIYDDLDEEYRKRPLNYVV